MKAVKGKIWDNYYYNDVRNEMRLNSRETMMNVPLKNRDKDGLKCTATTFKGCKNVRPGMFIRKVK